MARMTDTSTPNSQLSTPKKGVGIRAAIFLGVGIWVLGVVNGAVASAQPPTPALTDTVNDFAHIIDSASRAELDKRIRALKAASGDTVIVATVPTFQPYGSIDEYAVKMFENGGRGIGDKGKDNGLLVVLAVKDRKVGVEVGYDLEQFVTDGYSGEVIRTYMTPSFARGEYSAGLQAGLIQLIGRIAQARGVTLTGVPAPSAGRDTGLPISPGMIIFLIIVFALFSRMTHRSRMMGGRRWGAGPWSGWNSGVGPFGGGGGFGGGGFGGGFGGFGGGRSGGGGASGGW
jgi:uncharacterized protein